MEATVVIPCLNEEDYVGLILKDLSNQTVPSDVIVADCHSEDKTIEVAKNLGAKVVSAPYKSAGSARNAGAKLVKTPYILFLDADMRIPSNFTEEILKKAKSQNLDFVSPRFKSTGSHPLDTLNALVVNWWIIRNMKIYRKLIAAGGGILVKKETHDSAGGFDERIQQFNDIDYAKRVRKTKCSYGFARKAVASASNRRFVEQGRINSALQQLSPDYFIVRKFIRPYMKKVGIKPKWED